MVMAVLQDALEYDFADSHLLERALTHPSATTEKGENNQRLEFLGDAVLGLSIAQLLFELYPDEPEGDLAKRQSALVCGEQLAKIARTIGLNDALILAEGEASVGGRENDSSLEDACEALIGALYLDGGLETAQRFIHRYWAELARTTKAPPQDPKTALQEWAQGNGLPLPEYSVVEQDGPSHAPNFTIEVQVQGKEVQRATASSKKSAEREAARLLLESIR